MNGANGYSACLAEDPRTDFHMKDRPGFALGAAHTTPAPTVLLPGSNAALPARALLGAARQTWNGVCQKGAALLESWPLSHQWRIMCVSVSLQCLGVWKKDGRFHCHINKGFLYSEQVLLGLNLSDSCLSGGELLTSHIPHKVAGMYFPVKIRAGQDRFQTVSITICIFIYTERVLTVSQDCCCLGDTWLQHGQREGLDPPCWRRRDKLPLKSTVLATLSLPALASTLECRQQSFLGKKVVSREFMYWPSGAVSDL